jgi:hypothetical protein
MLTICVIKEKMPTAISLGELAETSDTGKVLRLNNSSVKHGRKELIHRDLQSGGAKNDDL